MSILLEQIDADETQRAGGGFHFRELMRIIRLTWPFRTWMFLGFASTLLFALLHTFSIGAAFPVFQVLLEEEPLVDWANRTVVQNRIGADIVPLESRDDSVLRVVQVHSGRSAAIAGITALDIVQDAQGRNASELLQEIAHAPDGAAVEITVVSALSDAEQTVTLRPQSPDMGAGALRTAVDWLPADIGDDKLALLKVILAALVIVTFVAAVFRYFGEVLIARAILRAMMTLRAQLYERTLHLPMAFFTAQPTADLVTRFVQDVQEIQRGMITLFGKFIREPLRAALILGLAFFLDWRITLTMLIVAPFAVLGFFTIGRIVKQANRKLLQRYGEMIGTLTNSLQNLRVVKTYTAEDIEQQRLTRVDWRMFKQQYKLARMDAFVSPMMETLAVIAGSIATVWLASRVIDGELSISKFAALGVALSMLFDPLRKLSDVYVRIQRSTAGADRIFSVIDQPVERNESPDRVMLGPLKDRLEYREVTFTYAGAETPALNEINLTINQGETVAVVGPNGSGKTTLVSLIPLLFTPKRGAILYDGVDLRNADLASLRRQISIVTQEAIVFGGTPIENIAYGDADVDVDRAMQAARRAHADDFISRLPGGYKSVLGERGTTLSGGQRQRLAIARAIYRDAPILIFDEATSQIDSESEQKIQHAVRELSTDRTTIIIAHRLSTIQFAKRIIVMESGRVIDTGSHEELYKRCPLYRRLCETQFGK